MVNLQKTNGMKNGLLVLNVILSIAVGYLLYTQWNSKKSVHADTKPSVKDSPVVNTPFRIAYFEMDSVEANFGMVKDVKAELSKKEEAINNELESLSKNFQQKYNYFQSEAQSGKLTQTQSETASQELKSLDDQLKNRKMVLDQEYSELATRHMNIIKNKIKEFLKDYNITKGYSYIASDDPGMFYYKDTIYNITPDVVKGLNERYKSKKD
jgi:outer membrane protein